MIDFFRRFPLLPASLLSLLLHVLVLGGVAGAIAVWWAMPPEREIKAIGARLARNLPPGQVAEPAEKPEEKPKEKPAVQPKKPPPEPAPSIQASEGPPPGEEEPDAEDAADAVPEADDGEEEGGWPDIPGRLEDVLDELEADSSEREPASYGLADGRIFPRKGEIGYRVYRGENRLEIGVARFSWELGQRTYRLTMAMKTTGLAAFIRPGRVETESVGAISSNGFYPLRYQNRLDGSVRETTVFDWGAHTLRMENRGRNTELTLRRESQDLLSLHGQLPFWVATEEMSRMPIPIRQDEPESETEAEPETETDQDVNPGWQGWTKNLWLAIGKRYDSFEVIAVGEEWLEFPGWDGLSWLEEFPGQNKRLATVHFRVSGRTETDFWLARDLYWLPVQIRHRDRNGDVYEQRINDYQFIEDEPPS